MIKKYLEIGKIVNTFGLRGEVKVVPWCDSAEFFCLLKSLYTDENGGGKIKVSSRPHKNMALCKIGGIDTPEQAERLIETVLFADRADMKLNPGTHFVQDLIGVEILNFNTGESYGNIKDVLKTGANDVYIVKQKSEDGTTKDLLIPAIPDIVKEKNVEAGNIKIVPMEGLFE